MHLEFFVCGLVVTYLWLQRDVMVWHVSTCEQLATLFYILLGVDQLWVALRMQMP